MDTLQIAQEQRIAERRNRIRRNMENAMLPQSSASKDIAGMASSPEPRWEGETAADEAERVMREILDDATRAVTEFRVKADVSEAERREKEEQRTNMLKDEIGCAAQETEIRFNAIALRFETLHNQTVPHELRDALIEQEKQCGELLDSKDVILQKLQSHLDEKEDEYVQLLKQNRADVEEMVQTMRRKTDEILDAYALQLDMVEKTYEKERREMMEKQSEEIQQLIKTRRTRETDYRKAREAKLLETQAKLADKYEESYEEFNEAKKKYLEDMGALAEELAKCKADFMLNGERLNYNLQVLRERLKENKVVQSQYKRKLARLQETLSNLVVRHRESESKYQRANKNLTAQLHRASAHYRDIQHKFQLFEKTDKAKYRQLHNMHNQQCKRLVHRCLQVDRVIFEDILNVPWSPPDLKFWPEEQEDLEGLDVGAEAAAAQAPIELDPPARMMLQMLRSQAPFLVDANVHAAIQAVQGTTEEQADVEAILTTLKLSKTDEVQDMLEFFMVDRYDAGDAVALISPQEAVHALIAFLEERKNREKLECQDDAEGGGAQGQGKNTPDSRRIAADKKKAEERHMAEVDYWKKLAECVPAEHLQIWDALEKGLEQYLSQLRQRKALIESTDTLRVQNQELKDLLQEYMRSNINYELCAPPQLIMQNGHV
ncbi:unnamed protein product [Phytomonas sp. EM1]|nr:unnamed protein product [Phytomonas sp. EM1]|eukprot:CCW63224.1 unnamed protein product [Phytomonas sp. isolate EM1]